MFVYIVSTEVEIKEEIMVEIINEGLGNYRNDCGESVKVKKII